MSLKQPKSASLVTLVAALTTACTQVPKVNHEDSGLYQPFPQVLSLESSLCLAPKRSTMLNLITNAIYHPQNELVITSEDEEFVRGQKVEVIDQPTCESIPLIRENVKVELLQSTSSSIAIPYQFGEQVRIDTFSQEERGESLREDLDLLAISPDSIVFRDEPEDPLQIQGIGSTTTYANIFSINPLEKIITFRNQDPLDVATLLTYFSSENTLVYHQKEIGNPELITSVSLLKKPDLIFPSADQKYLGFVYNPQDSSGVATLEIVTPENPTDILKKYEISKDSVSDLAFTMSSEGTLLYVVSVEVQETQEELVAVAVNQDYTWKSYRTYSLLPSPNSVLDCTLDSCSALVTDETNQLIVSFYMPN